jgi:avidin family protein
MKRLSLAASIISLFVSATPCLAQSLPEWSVWKNQRDSLLVVTSVDAAKNTFVGTFINRAPNTQCIGVGVPMSGEISGNSVKFVANFAPCSKTITIWSGTLSGTVLTTNYDLRYVAKDYTFGTDTGQDVFNKQ